MLSFEYKRGVEAAVSLIKLTKDVSYQSHLRELFDILTKWVLVRMWGGQPALSNLI